MKNGNSVGALHAMGKFPELLHCEEHPDSQQLCNTVSHLASTVSHIEDGGPVDEKALLAEAQKATENIIPMIKKNGNGLMRKLLMLFIEYILLNFSLTKKIMLKV